MKQLENLDTNFIGKNIIFYEDLPSTQALAHKLVLETVPNGTVVITNNQTAGKGTNDRVWYSSPNTNLTFTIILYPQIDMQKLEFLALDIANIITSTFQELYNIPLQVKHPNDIICNSKKIGGILTESKTYGNTATSLLIGIGLNINSVEIDNSIKEIATSLKLEYGRDFNIDFILTNLLNNIEKMYLSHF